MDLDKELSLPQSGFLNCTHWSPFIAAFWKGHDPTLYHLKF